MSLIVSLLLAQVTPAAPVVVVAVPKKERKICREQEGTGSRLGGVRECHTATEWKSLQGEIDGRDVNTMMNTKGTNSGASSNGATGGGIR